MKWRRIRIQISLYLAKKNSDRFDDIVQPLRDEGLGADAERCVQAGLDLGATAVCDVMA